MRLSILFTTRLIEVFINSITADTESMYIFLEIKSHLYFMEKKDSKRRIEILLLGYEHPSLEYWITW